MDDIVEEILKHLPTKSLRRFKSVSKPWSLMIESAWFTRKRFACWRLETPFIAKLFVVHPPSKNSKTFRFEIVSRDEDNNNGSISRCSYSFHDPINESNGRSIQVLGCCDGLVLVSFYKCSYIYLINPTTREHRTLSPPLRLPDERLYSVGLGKDKVTGSYKVILMYHITSDILKIKVFSLDTGEQREISRFFPISAKKLRNEQASVFANGSLFWLPVPTVFWLPFPFQSLENSVLRWKHKPLKLVAMDLHTEKFRQVSLPSWYTRYSPSMYMWSLNDRLCLSDVLQCPDMDIWSLQQEHPYQKWEKIFSFDVLKIGQLDANFWMLGLTSSYLRRRRHKEQDDSLDELRAISYLPTLISPYQGTKFV